MLTKEERQAAIKAADEEWWKGWWAADYSWEGLGRLDEDGDPVHPWIGWSVQEGTEAKTKTLIETSHATASARPANLQDYFRWDAASRRWRGDKRLIADGVLIETPSQPRFHILHLPERWKDGSESWKIDPAHPLWTALTDELERLFSHTKSCDIHTDGFEKGSLKGADHRAQLTGAHLRALPRPPTHPEHPDTDRARSTNSDAPGANPQADPPGAYNLAARHTRWLEHLHLGNARFDSPANFSQAQFSGGYANFYKAQFSGGDAYFNQAQFSGGDAFFWKTQFSGGDAYFNQAQFSGGYADFSDAQFSGGDAYFNQAQFSGGYADFSDAQFSGGDANFDKINAKHECRFIEAQFEKATYFRDCTFEGGVRYGDAFQFGLRDTAVRSGARFDAELSFRGSTFHALADFARCRFPEQAEHRNGALEGARFHETVDFKGVEHLPFSAFQGAIFDQGVLIGSDHPKNADFHRARNETEATVRRDTDILADPSYDANKDGDRDRRGRDARFAALEKGCLVLKHAMARGSDRQREQAFHRMELKARERRPVYWIKQKPETQISIFSNLASRFYGLVADYGASSSRPLLALLATAIIFFLLYTMIALGLLSQDTNQLWPDPDPALNRASLAALELALTNMLGPLKFALTDSQPFAAMTADAPATRLLLGLLSAGQSLISLILLFLSALALRRKFQIN
ncbi:pentapeptide repeat-containing protein [Maricaulis sp. W15]|uniref:pentapeptide repeat-containing protein n=1 Tax=Maricaulis sp. W15 TaxID=1772333 RepID=UPI000AB5A3E8|nr:pentapeptide repeat-containing protein [Maricaulis sp. W15]